MRVCISMKHNHAFPPPVNTWASAGNRKITLCQYTKGPSSTLHPPLQLKPHHCPPAVTPLSLIDGSLLDNGPSHSQTQICHITFNTAHWTRTTLPHHHLDDHHTSNHLAALHGQVSPSSLESSQTISLRYQLTSKQSLLE